MLDLLTAIAILAMALGIPCLAIAWLLCKVKRNRGSQHGGGYERYHELKGGQIDPVRRGRERPCE